MSRNEIFVFSFIYLAGMALLASAFLYSNLSLEIRLIMGLFGLGFCALAMKRFSIKEG